MIKPVLHHVTFKTSRIQEMVNWYKAVVGVQVNFQDANNAWTTNDMANHRLAFLTVPELTDDPAKIAHNGMHHTAFEYESFEDLMSSYARMRDIDITPAFSLHHGLTISLYYKDPEGNFVELQSDCFGSWEQSTRWMQTAEDFRTNPIGTFFDPELVYQAHQSGESFETLSPQMRDGHFRPTSLPNIGLPEPERVAIGL